MGEKNKKPTFTEAVQAIVESHTRLYDLLMEVLPAYRGEAEIPPRERRISRILDCETNDAHRLLENLATAANCRPASADTASGGGAPTVPVGKIHEIPPILKLEIMPSLPQVIGNASFMERIPYAVGMILK